MDKANTSSLSSMVDGATSPDFALQCKSDFGIPLRVPVHPGRFLHKTVFLPLRLSQTEVAKRLGVSRRRVNEIVQGRRALSADTALRCAILFHIPASFLLSLQAAWESYHAWRSLPASSPNS